MKSRKAGLVFPVSRFHRALREGKYADRIGIGGAVYMTAVLEYLSAELLELAGDAAHNNEKNKITPRNVMMAINKDSEFNQLLKHAIILSAGVMPPIHVTGSPTA